MFVDELKGLAQIKIIDGTVAGGRPRAPGEVIKVRAQEAAELIFMGRAERVVEAPSLKSS